MNCAKIVAHFKTSSGFINTSLCLCLTPLWFEFTHQRYHSRSLLSTNAHNGKLQIFFYSLGYGNGNSVPLKLYVSCTNGNRKCGVYAQLMLDACAIVAGNYPGNS
jgi:hypothetical protein